MTDTIHQTEELEETHATSSTIEDIRVDDDELEGADEGDLGEVIKTETVSIEKNDRSLSEFYRWYEEGSLILNTEWQRQYVWDKRRASRLIESFLINLPVPVIYLAQNIEGNYEVIDGLQRLTSVFDFFANKYELRGLEIKKDLNGYGFQELSNILQRKLNCKIQEPLRTFELSRETPKDLMFLIFERLNTGGISLNEMEIRNCLYRGKMNDLIKELAQFKEFKLCVNQKNIHRRMKDRALILRFLAFYQMTYTKARRGLRQAFFNEFCETYKDPTERKLDEFHNQFKKIN